MLIEGAAATGALALTDLPRRAGATEVDRVGAFQAGSVAPRAVHPEGTARDFGFDPPSSANPDRRIMFPVLGQVSWIDSYLHARGGGRRHEGQDLMGQKRLKLLACVDGVVVELRHQSSGNSLYIQGDDGWYYAYLHINNDSPNTDDGRNRFEDAFAPGLKKGDRVRRGQHVAFLGDSGNAEDAGSHLHFEIRQPHSGGLWRSSSVNPKASLQNAEPARERASVPPETFRPWDNAAALVDRQYRDLLGRPPSSGDTAYWTGLLNSGDWSPARLIEYFLISAECTDQVHAVTRLYRAYFLRDPDKPGFDYWVGRRRSGTTLARISDHFAVSSEFTTRYGDLTDAQFVDRVYQNVLRRDADAVGRDYWLGRLARGSSRGWVMVQFSESDEYKAATSRSTLVIGAYGCMMGWMPSPGDIEFWGARSTSALLDGIRLSDDYAGRVLGRSAGGRAR